MTGVIANLHKAVEDRYNAFYQACRTIADEHKIDWNSVADLLSNIEYADEEPWKDEIAPELHKVRSWFTIAAVATGMDRQIARSLLIQYVDVIDYYDAMEAAAEYLHEMRQTTVDAANAVEAAKLATYTVTLSRNEKDWIRQALEAYHEQCEETAKHEDELEESVAELGAVVKRFQLL